MARSSGPLHKEQPEVTRTLEATAPPADGLEPALTRDDLPSWIAAEMPPEHADIRRQIDKLREEARKFEKFADVLWRVGPPLTAGVAELFAAMGFPVTVPDPTLSYDLLIELDGPRRLLVEVVGGELPLDKRSPHITRALRAIQEDAAAGDRVVFACNIPCDKPLTARQEPPVTPEALRLIQGLGANIIMTPTLFGLWRYSMKDMAGARNSVHLLHALDGGIFR